MIDEQNTQYLLENLHGRVSKLEGEASKLSGRLAMAETAMSSFEADLKDRRGGSGQEEWSGGMRITGEPEQVKAMFAALAAAQADFAPIVKSKKVDVVKEGKFLYSFHYADLDAVLEATRPALNKHGLFLTTPYSQGNSAEVIRVLVTHSEGGRIETISQLRGDFRNEQERGSAITYRRRYMVSTILGVASEDDDDGNAAQGQTAVPKPQQQRQAPRQQQRREPPREANPEPQKPASAPPPPQDAELAQPPEPDDQTPLKGTAIYHSIVNMLKEMKADKAFSAQWIGQMLGMDVENLTIGDGKIIDAKLQRAIQDHGAAGAAAALLGEAKE